LITPTRKYSEQSLCRFCAPRIIGAKSFANIANQKVYCEKPKKRLGLGQDAQNPDFKKSVIFCTVL
jgi:hypothetical protein